MNLHASDCIGRPWPCIGTFPFGMQPFVNKSQKDKTRFGTEHPSETITTASENCDSIQFKEN